MRRVLAVCLFIGLAASAHAEMKWAGGAGVRRLFLEQDDSLNTKSATTNKDTSTNHNRRWEFRAALGVADKGEMVDWGLGIRTQANAASEWLSTANNTDKAIGLELAYARLHRELWGAGDGSVAVGRQKTVLLYDNVSQVFLDNDNRWDGFGWTWKMGDFGLNATQYVLGATSQGTAGASNYTKTESSDTNANTQSHFGMLYSVQPFYIWKVSDEITGKFAVGYHSWAGTGGSNTSGWYSNTIHGGVGIGTGSAAESTNPVILDNAQQWQALTDWSLPYDVRLVGEYIRNKKVVYGTRLAPTTIQASRVAWALSAVWGAPKKAHDYSLAYSYVQKGIASVVGTFTNGDMAPDNNSHLFEAKYFLADGIVLGGKLQLHRERAKLDGAGVAPTGVDANHNEKQRRIEFYTNVIL